jgi:hypothetical protein
MAEAGFSFWFEGPPPAPDRFLLVFGKTDAKTIRPQDDLFVAGPQIRGTPEQWLRENGWRLRGLQTVDGKVVAFSEQGRRAKAETVSPASGEKQVVNIPDERLRLVFEKNAEGYALTGYQSSAE